MIRTDTLVNHSIIDCRDHVLCRRRIRRTAAHQAAQIHHIGITFTAVVPTEIIAAFDAADHIRQLRCTFSGFVDILRKGVKADQDIIHLIQIDHRKGCHIFRTDLFTHIIKTVADYFTNLGSVCTGILCKIITDLLIIPSVSRFDLFRTDHISGIRSQYVRTLNGSHQTSIKTDKLKPVCHRIGNA